MKNTYREPIQREIPVLSRAMPSKWLSDADVRAFESYREVVIWCWKNRPRRGLNDPDDQAMFARLAGVHAPHMSRYVSLNSSAPMDLKPDLIPEFEAYTGWRGITQYLAHKAGITVMEHVIAKQMTA